MSRLCENRDHGNMVSNTPDKHRQNSVAEDQALREGLGSFRRSEPHDTACTTYFMATPVRSKRMIALKPTNPALSKAKGATVTLWKRWSMHNGINTMISDSMRLQ